MSNKENTKEDLVEQPVEDSKVLLREVINDNQTPLQKLLESQSDCV